MILSAELYLFIAIMGRIGSREYELIVHEPIEIIADFCYSLLIKASLFLISELEKFPNGYNQIETNMKTDLFPISRCVYLTETI